MKELIFPILMIFICIAGMIALQIYLKYSKNKAVSNARKTSEGSKKSAQDFVNVKDIQDIFLYTMDGYIISYIKVQSFEKDLLSETEKKVLTKKSTQEFSELEEGFKFIAVSRPVDITPLVIDYADLMKSSSSPIQKQILRNEIAVVSDFSLSGEVVQREFYYMIWEKENEDAEADLKKRINDLQEKLSKSGFKCDIIKKPDIIRLCNLVNNPAFATIEGTDTDVTFPFLEY